LAKGYDGVCVFVNDTVNNVVIEKLIEYGIKAVLLRCAGFNNVDIKYINNRIKVVRVPAYSPYAVAEHTIALLLTSIRRIHKAYIRSRDYNFSLSGLTGFDLHGKTIGVIGTGRIGKAFIDICKGFGMKVIAYDKFPDNSIADGEKVKYVELSELFKNSDIISLHCPLMSDTHHIIDSDAISSMKKGVVILNTSRGALVDAEALLSGIKSRKVGAACLDVYEEESDVFFEDKSGHIMEDDVLARLISMPNVIVTSHQAFLTEEALENIAETTIRNFIAIMSGEYCENEICLENQR
jgi:D-lactate dehydrogenase